MPLHHDGPAPYGPPQTVIDILTAFRDRGLSTPFTADVLGRVGVPDTLSNRVLQTLRLLDLIDERGEPTPIMTGLRDARGSDQYQERCQEWLRGVYADVLQFADPTVDGPERLTEAFRGFTPAGQRSRMVTLMIGLFRHAGLIEGPVAKRESKPRAAGRVHRASGITRTVSAASGQGKRIPAPAPIDAAAPDLPPALVGLLRQVPTDGRGWDEETREKFLSAFTAVLDFTVPMRPTGLEDLTDAEVDPYVEAGGP